MVSKKPRSVRKWLLYPLGFVLVWLGALYVVDFFPEKEKELLGDLRTAVVETFPEEAAEIASTYGLSLLSEVDSTAASVVLMHGLDDPGKVWMVLAPELSTRGMNVWQMRYPNDQPVADSALLLKEELATLKQSGVNEISLVAHSMGGLVSREMLTNPQMAYTKEVENHLVPRVRNLIMVGTPNHGSELARFRIFSEIRDQWVNMVENGGNVLSGVLDGAGEARIDLLPDSQLLKTLNARPQPANTNMLIIAGIANPWDEKEINQFLNSTLDEENAQEIKSLITSMSDALGDGLVTVESTRLEGIEHMTVPGTHLSMIRNLSEDSSRIPPAVPLIIEYLEQTAKPWKRIYE